jgi:hypothetical protein
LTAQRAGNQKSQCQQGNVVRRLSVEEVDAGYDSALSVENQRK